MNAVTWSGWFTSRFAIAATRARHRGRVRSGHYQDPAGSDERIEPVEERARVVDVLDHLARDDHIGRREAERAHRVGVAAVDDVAS